MYTLKGVFPEPKKEQKKNFIKENMKQLKFIQGKSPRDQDGAGKNVHHSRQLIASAPESSVNHMKSSSSGRVKPTLNVAKNASPTFRKRRPDIRIKKGDMAEFLKRKELRQTKSKPAEEPPDDEDDAGSECSLGVRDIGCQTIESNLAQKLAESTKLTMIYPKKELEDNETKANASGDSASYRNMSPVQRNRTPEEGLEIDKNHSRLNAILERKGKDPYLPSGYQKGVLPKYLHDRKEQGPKEIEGAKADDSTTCPPGHVPLPDTERKETLRMLRNSFAELVSELNKMPVKTDTLRMRNRKMELEKQLAKLEEGIKVFSRPKVFVKIGE
ncbi:enkurin domain-containing protein 1-like [Battus philenor]|uniref:enkurin domain-containing protein 1-like n=1 Tax=Battus philenor TaxID=42288 RepID=UPI0035CF5123